MSQFGGQVGWQNIEVLDGQQRRPLTGSFGCIVSSESFADAIGGRNGKRGKMIDSTKARKRCKPDEASGVRSVELPVDVTNTLELQWEQD